MTALAGQEKLSARVERGFVVRVTNESNRVVIAVCLFPGFPAQQIIPAKQPESDHTDSGCNCPTVELLDRYEG